MVSHAETKDSKGDKQKHPKLRRLPNNARIQKRPILHPPIPSPYAGANQPKVIYISSKTPFVAVVKRVRKLLSLIDKRSVGNVDLINAKGNDKQKLRALGEKSHGSKEKEPEEVLLKATNKAIEKVLGLALFFQGQEDCRVRLRTGTVGVVDDIVETAVSVDPPRDHIPTVDTPRDDTFQCQRNQSEEPMVIEDEKARSEEEEEELPETQIRKMSVVEVGISLK